MLCKLIQISTYFQFKDGLNIRLLKLSFPPKTDFLKYIESVTPSALARLKTCSFSSSKEQVFKQLKLVLKHFLCIQKMFQKEFSFQTVQLKNRYQFESTCKACCIDMKIYLASFIGKYRDGTLKVKQKHQINQPCAGARNIKLRKIDYQVKKIALCSGSLVCIMYIPYLLGLDNRK